MTVLSAGQKRPTQMGAFCPVAPPQDGDSPDSMGKSPLAQRLLVLEGGGRVLDFEAFPRSLP